MVSVREKEIFDKLCGTASCEMTALSEERGIGIYNEKRLHRILKRTFCDKEECFEIKVGKYTADVLENGKIYEIQCGGLYPLKEKISYYLEKTDFEIEVVHPLIVKKTIIRVNEETGEVMRRRKSPKVEDFWDILPMLYPLCGMLGEPRLSIKLMFIEVEEYRYSEAVRYRRKGKYDNDVFPLKLVDSVELNGVEDYRVFVPDELLGKEFTAADYEKLTPYKNRDIYLALNSLCGMGILYRRKKGKGYLYGINKT